MISCLIPAYNEEKYIKNTIESLKNTNLIDEIIVIDDASTDKTFEIIKKIKGIKIIKNYKNLGKTKCILRGLKSSSGNTILLVDADLQGLNYFDLSNLIKPVENNELDITIAYGIPFVLKKFSGLRCLKREIFNLLNERKLKTANYGLEKIINKAIKKHNLKFKYIKMQKIRNIHKIKKYGLIKGLKLTIKMYLEIIINLF
ncbi:MAG: hypothetical protein KatS3mg094_200 [Candidatus Parcubacteria bacterium]|nr:MAG: hypothetical protein KatS3mg094_200 [Candidatus Parcubacteria bacterium]